MRTVLTLLMVLVAASASAQISIPKSETPPQDSVVVEVARPDTTQTERAKPDTVIIEVAKPDSTQVVAENEVLQEETAPQTHSRATVQTTAHGDAQTIINNNLRSGPKKMKAYRVMIFFGNSPSARSEAGSIRGRFSKLFPGYATYMFYENPYFKVTAGNFYTKEEAQIFLERVRKHFSTAFIVQEDVNVSIFAK